MARRFRCGASGELLTPCGGRRSRLLDRSWFLRPPDTNFSGWFCFRLARWLGFGVWIIRLPCVLDVNSLNAALRRLFFCVGHGRFKGYRPNKHELMMNYSRVLV